MTHPINKQKNFASAHWFALCLLFAPIVHAADEASLVQQVADRGLHGGEPLPWPQPCGQSSSPPGQVTVTQYWPGSLFAPRTIWHSLDAKFGPVHEQVSPVQAPVLAVYVVSQSPGVTFT